MSKLMEYAKKELDYIWPPQKIDDLQHYIKKDVLNLMDVFCNQGHSGSSAPYVLTIFSRLANWKPILPLTGDESEWGEPFGEDFIQQNKRCGTIFRKYHDNKTAYNSEGKVFSDDYGQTWYSNKDSHVPIEFPYIVPDAPEHIIITS